MKFIRDVRDDPEPEGPSIYVKTRYFWVFLLSQAGVQLLVGNVPGALASVIVIGAVGTPIMAYWDRRRAASHPVRSGVPAPPVGRPRLPPVVDG